MDNITDLWFRTDLELEELAKEIGLENVFYDVENYWEWVTGSFGTYKLDITRTHTVESVETETRVFLLGENKEFEKPLLSELVSKLKKIGIAEVNVGSWEYISGNDYKIKKVQIDT